MKKHDDFQKDVAASEARLDAINTLAQTMIDDGHSDADEIQRLTEVGLVPVSCEAHVILHCYVTGHVIVM